MGNLAPPVHAVGRSELARLIDQTLLRPSATSAEVNALCSDALRYGFWSVCVNPCRVTQAALAVKGSGVRVCSVVSFPFGASTTGAKLAEARKAVEDGAVELDLVSNFGALRSGDDRAFAGEVAAASDLSHGSGAILKVILEGCYLSDEEKVRGARLAEDAGADFVKTSTGYGTSGATAADVALLRRSLSPGTGVKAAGGIGSLE